MASVLTQRTTTQTHTEGQPCEDTVRTLSKSQGRGLSRSHPIIPSALVPHQAVPGTHTEPALYSPGFGVITLQWDRGSSTMSDAAKAVQQPELYEHRRVTVMVTMETDLEG